MSVPQPMPDVEPSERLRSLRQQRHKRQQQLALSTRFRAFGWELTGRLTVNLVVTLVAFAALVRLIPYHQTQRQVLQELETSTEAMRAQNNRLRGDFSRYFDPSQTSQVLQENGARESTRRIPIVWVDKMPSKPAVTTPEGERAD